MLAYLLRLKPLVLGQVVVEDAALGGTLEAVSAVVLLAGGQARQSLHAR